MPVSTDALQSEIEKQRRRLDELEKLVHEIEEDQNMLIDVVRGNKDYQRKGLVDDLASLQAFVSEIKEFKGKAVGIGLFLTTIGIPVGLWAAKNLDFIQNLFGKK